MLEVMKFVPNSKRQHLKKNLYMKNFGANMKKEEIEAWIKENVNKFGEILCSGVYLYKKGD